MLVPIETLLFKEPVTAGMDIYTLATLTRLYRNSNEHTTPITIRRETDETWRIMDGRHRVVASMMAGRKHILATEEPQGVGASRSPHPTP
jgi:hypothetical protein